MKVDIKDITKFELLPSETLVIKMSRSMSPIYSKNFEKKFTELFPYNTILFMPEGMEISSIIKEQEG